MEVLKMKMKRYIVRKLGDHRGSPRVYLEIDAMSAAGFAPGKTYTRSVDMDKRRLTLTTQPNGDYVVCKKEKQGKQLPVIDINSAHALRMFEGMDAVRIVVLQDEIHILPIASELARIKRLERLKANLDKGMVTTAGISFGGGVLDHAAHSGFQDAGINAELVMANEIDEQLLEHAIEHNDIWQSQTLGVAAPMQELAMDDAAMARLPQADAICLGIPCSGASRAGKSKNKLEFMEQHASVGGLISSAIMLINRIQPSILVVENVTDYSSSASAEILRFHLKAAGYNVQETVLDASDFGSLEARKRWFLVGSTVGIPMNIDDLAPKLRPVKMLRDVLEDVPPDSPEWREVSYLKEKMVRDTEKGNSFAMQYVTPESTSVPTLRKNCFKGGSTDPRLLHPSNPDLSRLLNATEHARIKEVPAHLIDGLSNSGGHALLGQGIAYSPVRALFRRIGDCLQAWKDGAVSQVPSPARSNLLLATG
jgi:DNA (cytosine-5)-methyltransferase 1